MGDIRLTISERKFEMIRTGLLNPNAEEWQVQEAIDTIKWIWNDKLSRMAAHEQYSQIKKEQALKKLQENLGD